ncbi:hypothetical protein GWI33_019390 [Rhynchophorus ferrugineus]|uniref:Uncharacterized protein n=1 Tax=Rhynchophorus ferrugineus TaxID=354439 RepID=A0A834M0J4_RHYFE|nr:hypothetical protein GWI33_019390 [Rhynchophorus ferrugineus]
MNYLKNRYPFKFISNILRMASQKVELLNKPVDLKRNRSDSFIAKDSTFKNCQSVSPNLKKSYSANLKYSNIERKSSASTLRSTTSSYSLPFSKTSSEHSIQDSPQKSHIESNNSSSETINDERLRLKRTYPWQNFNLQSVELKKSDIDCGSAPAKVLVRKTDARNSESEHLLKSRSKLSFNSSTSSLSRTPSRDNLVEIRDQMQLFKSVTKSSKLAHEKPLKEVTFNSISTIYGSKPPYAITLKESKPHMSTQSHLSTNTFHVPVVKNRIDKDLESVISKQEKRCENCGTKRKLTIMDSSLGKCEALKEENSFLFLYNNKRSKIA